MPSHRPERVAEAIREVVSTAILFEVADPRVKGVTVLRAEVSPDIRHARVYVSIMGTEAEQTLAMRGLQHARGFLQSKVAARLQTRYTPNLSFSLDEGVKKSIEISRLIDEAIAADNAKPDHTPDAPSPAGQDPDEDVDLEVDDDEDDSLQAERVPPWPHRARHNY
jgi:ribosome-binding factor A